MGISHSNDLGSDNAELGLTGDELTSQGIEETPKYSSFISIFTIENMEAKIQYVSPSISECLGYEPEEFIKLDWKDIVHPDDLKAMEMVQKENVMKSVMGQLILVRVKCKPVEGSQDEWAMIENVTTIGYDCLIAVCCRVDGTVRSHTWRQTASEIVQVSADGHVLRSTPGTPTEIKEVDVGALTEDIKPEMRFVMICDRFTTALNVVFISKSSLLLVGQEKDLILGKSLFDFIVPEDVDQVKEGLAEVRSSSAIERLRFRWINSNKVETPVEALVVGAADGLAVMVRHTHSI